MSSIGDYERHGLLSSGMFGEVYLASDKQQKLYAVKVMIRSRVPMHIFRAESGIQMRLLHENVVQLKSAFVTDATFSLVMEYMDAGSVTNFLEKQGGPLDEKSVRNISSQLMSGLSYIHSQAVLHRDIKPCNLLMNVEGVVKVADFGTAVQTIDGKPTIGYFGSPYYMAPEVVARQPYSYPADLWSAAISILVIICSPEKFDCPPADEMQVIIPAEVSPPLRQLLVALLQVHPPSRLTAQEALAHDWFRQ